MPVDAFGHFAKTMAVDVESGIPEAIEAAICAYAEQPADLAASELLARLIRRNPEALNQSHRGILVALLQHPWIDPLDLGPAGWNLVLDSEAPIDAGGTGESDAVLAATLEQDSLALALLSSCPVYPPKHELRMRQLRRWLLLSGNYPAFPALAEALCAQARLNGGAWYFDESEADLLVSADSGIRACFLPRSGKDSLDGPAGDVTQRVKRLYDIWPYPPWTRITRGPSRSLRAMMREIGPAHADKIPENPAVLVAGCGTGRQVAHIATEFPEARITAIDISGASIAFAHQQCSAIGLTSIRFERLDIRDVARLGQQFDVIFCAGVLHHMPDPEAGMMMLCDVLRPNGVMKIGVYSSIARMFIEAAAKLAIDGTDGPVDDNRARAVRRVLLDQPDNPVAARLTELKDFATLQGTCDLLLHPHSDNFDFPRIGRMIASHGMDLLHVELSRHFEFAYRLENPRDPLYNDIESLQKFELRNPLTFLGMYRFWCANSK